MNGVADFSLTSEGEEPLQQLLKRVVQLTADMLAAGGGRSGLTQRQYALLSSLSEQEGTSQADLVRRTGIDRSTLADLARRLEEKGYLTRRRCPRDRRAYSLHLTGRGRKALRSMAPLMEEVEELLLSALPREHAVVFKEALRLLASEETARRLVRLARDHGMNGRFAHASAKAVIHGDGERRPGKRTRKNGEAQGETKGMSRVKSGPWLPANPGVRTGVQAVWLPALPTHTVRLAETNASAATRRPAFKRAGGTSSR